MKLKLAKSLIWFALVKQSLQQFSWSSTGLRGRIHYFPFSILFSARQKLPEILAGIDWLLREGVGKFMMLYLCILKIM